MRSSRPRRRCRRAWPTRWTGAVAHGPPQGVHLPLRGLGVRVPITHGTPRRAMATLDHPPGAPLYPPMTPDRPPTLRRGVGADRIGRRVDDPRQGGRLVDRGPRVPAGGQIVEIGSFRGRSMIVLARSAAPGPRSWRSTPTPATTGAPGDRRLRGRGRRTTRCSTRNLERAGVRDRVTTCGSSPTTPTTTSTATIDLLLHRRRPPLPPGRDDIRAWGAGAPGGTMLIHDSFSSIGVTLAIRATLLATGEWRYVGRSRSLTEYHESRSAPRAGWATRSPAGAAALVRPQRADQGAGHRQARQGRQGPRPRRRDLAVLTGRSPCSSAPPATGGAFRQERCRP